ncbi:hypothetical protein [Microvirga puerhi]|uniref:Lipoprotein n=1 Tax=Microvirga puerhi TaxID=2876078 RepID=A0ABS7VGS3_9HYPH|nr:hypothetical protein [Microvirga puerhi]MBZ6074704.1 hypothetical protein [Microvirga puerhi]
MAYLNRVGMLMTLALWLAACASSSTGGSLWDYKPGSGVTVKTRCGGYLVALHPSALKLMVTPYAGNIARPICESFKNPPKPIPLVTGVAYEEGAYEYLAANRPNCRVVAGERLTPLHSEFTFACPAAPKTK